MRKNCKDCPDRAVGCHGKNEDGTWKCDVWARTQESRAGEPEEKKIAREINQYKGVSIRKMERRRRWHSR